MRALLAALLAAASAQAPPPTFTAGAEAVYVDVFVTEGNRPVTGLTAADFELKDNGAPQPVELSPSSARAALNLYHQHRPKKPVAAVIYTHSHVDHYGGVKGVVSEDDVKAGKVKIIAPDGFLKAATDENVMAGTAMSRRAGYMYGVFLPPGPQGKVTMGLGLTVSTGSVSLIPPTDIITKTVQEMVLDGLTFIFQLAPDTEAPAEMHFYLPQLKVLCPAENCCHNLHNVLNLRGAKIRDALAWSKNLNESLERWGDKSEVMLNVHHWPIWGRERLVDRLKRQRDMYRYLRDQTETSRVTSSHTSGRPPALATPRMYSARIPNTRGGGVKIPSDGSESTRST